eukprot:5316815-Alexandrium_andersonii.AAC.1
MTPTPQQLWRSRPDSRERRTALRYLEQKAKHAHTCARTEPGRTDILNSTEGLRIITMPRLIRTQQ